MTRYIDAEKLEKDGWSVSRIYQQDAKTMIYEIKKITDFPTADVVERKKGKWITCVNSDHWKCNQCGCRAGFWFNEENSSEWENDMSEWLSDYCPNCGAEMRKETEDA